MSHQTHNTYVEREMVVELPDDKMQEEKNTNTRPSASPSSSNNLYAHALDSKIDENEDARFIKSLQELKDLRTQLRYAADYCEKSFLKTNQKKRVVENTKEYVCRAMVTVVDHLGSISANLECCFSGNKQISDTELRLHCLNQRLLMCQDYEQKRTLSRVRWYDNSPRYNKHYVLPTNSDVKKSNGMLRDFDDSVVPRTMPKYKLNAKEEESLLLSPYAHNRSSSLGLSPVIPLLDNSVLVTIPRNLSFHFQETKKIGRNERSRRMLQIPWRNKRTT